MNRMRDENLYNNELVYISKCFTIILFGLVHILLDNLIPSTVCIQPTPPVDWATRVCPFLSDESSTELTVLGPNLNTVKVVAIAQTQICTPVLSHNRRIPIKISCEPLVNKPV